MKYTLCDFAHSLHLATIQQIDDPFRYLLCIYIHKER